MVNTKTVSISSCFPASTDEIWGRLQQIGTLQYIADPYATFEPIGDMPLIWIEGGTSKLILKLFGVINLGVHTIYVKEFNKDVLTIYTNESNKYVPVWNHRIVLQKADSDEMTNYRDDVEIFAGWKTPMVAIWSRLFYKHRQKKWLSLLKCDKSVSKHGNGLMIIGKSMKALMMTNLISMMTARKTIMKAASDSPVKNFQKLTSTIRISLSICLSPK